jgi:hypothetical protein
MVGVWARIVPLVVVGLAGLYNNPYPLLNRFGGRLQDFQPSFDHVGHGALNNDKCWTFPGIYEPSFSDPWLGGFRSN